MTYKVEERSLRDNPPDWFVKAIMDGYPDTLIDVRKVVDDIGGLSAYIPVSASQAVGIDDLAQADPDWREGVLQMINEVYSRRKPKEDDALLLSPQADGVIILSKDALRVRLN